MSLFSWQSFFSFEGLCDYIKLTHIIHDNLSILRSMALIVSAKSPLPYNLTYSQFPGRRHGHQGWGAQFGYLNYHDFFGPGLIQEQDISSKISLRKTCMVPTSSSPFPHPPISLGQVDSSLKSHQTHVTMCNAPGESEHLA